MSPRQFHVVGVRDDSSRVMVASFLQRETALFASQMMMDSARGFVRIDIFEGGEPPPTDGKPDGKRVGG